MRNKYVIGVDYGTDSARAVIIDTSDGAQVSSSVMNYPRWTKGLYCDPVKSRYRQHPLDYVEVLEFIVYDAMAKAPRGTADDIVGISFDTTGSTPVLTDENGVPLALRPEFSENHNAMFILWKDHTAVMEAAQINALAKEWHTDYTKYEGGVYSSEWVWAKITHVLRDDPSIRKDAFSWIEHCDWMHSILTGKTRPAEVVRSRCAAGHKAMWHPQWEGLPPEDFFVALDPLLAGFRDRLSRDTVTADKAAGHLTEEWARRFGLSTGVVVGVGAFDCHMGAVGGGIKPGYLARAIGTSTCDIMIAEYEDIGSNVIAGICGQVDGSVMPGYVGLEAGQSGFGDIYAWFKNVVVWPIEMLVPGSADVIDGIIPRLSEEAAKIPAGETAILTVDWMNGRRTPDANQQVKGTIAGLDLSSTAPRIFRALVEGTAFGSRAIADCFRREGVAITGVIGLGGVAKKSEFVMQTMADVMNMRILVTKSDQTCAAGAAMFAAVAAGVYPTIGEAQAAMGQGFEREYIPNENNREIYDGLYRKYIRLGNFTEKEL